MPRYDFLNTKTNEVEEHKMSYTELDKFKEDNPHLERHHTLEAFPGYGDGMRMNTPGTIKADSAFEKYVIDRIKKTVPGNRLGETHKTKMPREW